MLNAPLPPQPLELDFQTLEIYFQKSSCFANRGTFPWSAFVDSDILGMLNAPLTFQQFEPDFRKLELDFPTLNHDNLARVHYNPTGGGGFQSREYPSKS